MMGFTWQYSVVCSTLHLWASRPFPQGCSLIGIMFSPEKGALNGFLAKDGRFSFYRNDGSTVPMIKLLENMADFCFHVFLSFSFGLHKTRWNGPQTWIIVLASFFSSPRSQSSVSQSAALSKAICDPSGFVGHNDTFFKTYLFRNL